MKKVTSLVLAVFFCCYSHSEVITVPIGNTGYGVTIGVGETKMIGINTNPNATQITTVGEDQVPTNVPLGFNFPYGGQVFNQSWMSENGVVTFQDPQGRTYCCSALPLTSLNNPAYDYTMFPLWTDWSTQQGGELYTLSGTNSQTYGWYNVNEYGTNNKASFELTVNSDGTFSTSMSGAIVSRHSVMSGFKAKGEEGFQSFYKYADGIENQTQTWKYGLLPTPDVLLNDTYVLRADTKTVEFYTFEMYEGKKRGIDFVGYDPRVNTSNNPGEEEDEEEKKKKEEIKLNKAERSKYLENLKADIKSGKIGSDDYFKNDLLQMEAMNRIQHNNVALSSIYQKSTIPDAPFYKDKGVYRNQNNVDNERAQRALSSDGTHQQMIDQQWVPR